MPDSLRTRSMRTWSQLLVCASCCLTLAGCGSGTPPGPEVVLAKGKVSIEGDPLTGARLFFVPEAGSNSAIAGVASTDSEGVFEVVTNGTTGAAPGRYRVAVQYYTKPDGTPFSLTESDTESGMDLDQFIAMGQVKLGVPRRYSDPTSTDLLIEIPEAGIENIELILAKK